MTASPISRMGTSGQDGWWGVYPNATTRTSAVPHVRRLVTASPNPKITPIDAELITRYANIPLLRPSERIEAAPPAPVPRPLLPSACPFPCVRRRHLVACLAARAGSVLGPR